MLNSVVWVLMAATYGGYWIPTLEFDSEEKCRSAVSAMEQTVGKAGALAPGIRAKCTKIVR